MDYVQLFKAGQARLKQAIAHAEQVTKLLNELKRGAKPEDKMPKLRILTASLSQCVHEFNAYSNAAE